MARQVRDSDLPVISLGAYRVQVGQGPDVSWVVLADPEGNEFCVLTRSVQEV
ncbi:VOC family protein [Modestobacter sp. DSM 44400]|uniref:VOC family protein n=1 Tax=Modestobacter sp. DSM 44400 TaxID=1550230 RepID=UPI00211030B1|nr:VOC family protein [Modestobacter sp. DSM 44400]